MKKILASGLSFEKKYNWAEQTDWSFLQISFCLSSREKLSKLEYDVERYSAQTVGFLVADFLSSFRVLFQTFLTK